MRKSGRAHKGHLGMICSGLKILGKLVVGVDVLRLSRRLSPGRGGATGRCGAASQQTSMCTILLETKIKKTNNV